MSRFNTTTEGLKTQNFAGGQAYKESAQFEFVSMLLASFANSTFYEKADDRFERMETAISSIDPLFAAKAAVYARRTYGMRSITHIAASKLAPSISGKPWAQAFYKSIVFRPDDMTEIVSLFNGKLPNALKKGFAAAFGEFDEYQLAKYRAGTKKVKLVDVANMVHPVPNEKNKVALEKLMKGTLASVDTWEAKLTQAGQKAENETDKANLKKDAWVELIRSRKLGYFALLRNLRNIASQAPEILPEALVMLTDEKLIKKSMVLPFRFITAYEELRSVGGNNAILNAIAVALEISLANVPKFDGSTLVVLDVSGSMLGKPATIGSLFASVLVKTNNADFMVFSDDAKYVPINTRDSVITIANGMKFAAGGTNFHSIFQKANKPYDRIVILSDMQGWVGYNTPTADFNAWKKRYNANPFLYSFDLNGYDTLQFPENQVFCLAGFSDKVFDVMKLLETDKNALINTINQVEFK